MESFKPFLAKVAAGAKLTQAEAAEAFDAMLSGEVTPAQMGGFLMALRVRGETVDESPAPSPPCARKMLRVGRPTARSTSSAPAATARHLQRLDARLRHRAAAACRSPSTAIARRRRNPARATS